MWSRLKESRLARIGGQVLLVLVAVLVIRAYQTWDAAKGDAPSLVVRSIAGETVELAALRGEPVVVHFFATWCGVCKAEEHNVKAVAEDHAMIAIASQSGRASAVSAYVAEHGLEMPVVTDMDGSLADSWGVSAFPTTFVVDPDGQIASVEVGYMTELGLRSRLFMAGL